MKTTLDLPDDLYRRVKAKSAMEGRPVREVTIELYRQWLGDGGPSGGGVERLAAWFELADTAAGDAPAGPTARSHLTDDRNRRDRR